jgi:glycerate 2-kinase
VGIASLIYFRPGCPAPATTASPDTTRRPKDDVNKIFGAALRAADPSVAVSSAVRLLDAHTLCITVPNPPSSPEPTQSATFDLRSFNRVVVVGAGKASVPMARALQSLLASRIARGHIITKHQHATDHGLSASIAVSEAGHPIPDQDGVVATQRLLDTLK